jgi:Tfp pilus assembly protein PilO
MNSWIPKNKIVRFSAAAAVLCTILYFCMLFFVLNDIKKIKDFYQSSESKFTKNAKIAAIKSISENNTAEIQSLRDFFVQKGDEVKFIEKIEETARNAGITFDISSISVKNGSNSFEENVEIKVDVEGTWKSIIAFADKLEKMPFGVSVERMALDAPSPGHWSGSVNVVVFREK